MPRSVLFYGTYVCRKQVVLIVKDYIFIDAGRRSLVSYDYCHWISDTSQCDVIVKENSLL